MQDLEYTNIISIKEIDENNKDITSLHHDLCHL